VHMQKVSLLQEPR